MKKAVAVALLCLCHPLLLRAQANEDPRDQVRNTESAFARTMADRDHAAFASFLADDTVFFGPGGVHRGKESVAQAWKPLFDAKQVPFSWAPEKVEVLQSGDLALSSGPVFDPAGKRVGTFNSVWKKQRDGSWRIVFDNGCPRCDCGANEADKPRQ